MASILILVPALCIAIVYIIYVLRHSYKPEPISFVGSSESYKKQSLLVPNSRKLLWAFRCYLSHV